MSIGEEAVARMDGFGLRFDRRLKNGFFVGVAFCGVGGTDAVGEVVKLDVQGVLVGVRVDGDGFDAELLAGTGDVDGDFAAVGDEDSLEHRCSLLFHSE